MFIHTTLTTHAEKIAFVLAYLNGKAFENELNRPLFICGSGGNGKTKVLQEVANLVAHPFAHMNLEKTIILHSGQQVEMKSQQWLPLIVEILGTNEDKQFAEYMDGYCVEFAKDPAFSQG